MKKIIFLIVVLMLFDFCKINENDNNDDSNPVLSVFYVSPDGNDDNDGSINDPWKTIQHGVNNINAGDKLVIKSGTYNEKIYINKSGEEGKEIIIEGEDVRNTIITGANLEGDTIFMENSSYIKLTNLTMVNGGRAGIRLSYSDNIELTYLLIGNCGKWGIFTDFSNHTYISNCEVSGSKSEHGIYISNSSDNATIRNSIVYNNYACGIQINADPSMGGDGISIDCLIENNILYGNGTGGGAAINLASTRDSVIQNNLIFKNYAGGIALWDDAQGYEWGCKNNKLIHNTIYFAQNYGRWCISVKNGSTGNTIYNNVMSGGRNGGFEYDNSSVSNLIIDNNIYYRYGSVYVISNEDNNELTLGQWKAMGYDKNSFTNSPEGIFKSLTSNDYHLRSSSPAIDKGINANLSYDFEGDSRPKGNGYDIGCDEY